MIKTQDRQIQTATDSFCSHLVTTTAIISNGYEVVGRRLSDVLELTVDSKYYLSSTATNGILRRAAKRGKQLPEVLEEALIIQSLGGIENGQTKIDSAVEVLRVLWQKNGYSETLEWLCERGWVSKETVLRYSLRFKGEISSGITETDKRPRSVKAQGKNECAEKQLCGLRKDWVHGSTSCGFQSAEQLKEQFSQIVSEVSHGEAQPAYVMYCLRRAAELERIVYAPLSNVTSEARSGDKRKRSNISNNGNIQKQSQTELLDTDPSLPDMWGKNSCERTMPTALRGSQTEQGSINGASGTLTPWDTQGKRTTSGDGIAPTLSGSDGGGGRNPAGLVAIPINTMVATRHNADDNRTTFGVGEDGEPQFTLQSAHSHAVCTEENRGGSR